MVADLAAGAPLAEVDPVAARVLAGPRRPIVLLPRARRRPRSPAPSRPGNRMLGLMLPYTPLHHLLCRELGAPFVLTSGNVSDEPIAYDGRGRLRAPRGIADVFLTHDRPIHMRDRRLGRPASSAAARCRVRRSRGYAPQPLLLPLAGAAADPRLRRGAEEHLLPGEGRPRLSLAPHRRPRELRHAPGLHARASSTSAACSTSRPRSWRTISTPSTCRPSTRSSSRGVELVGVQHHHAHVAACLADNGEEGPAIGVAFDGLGFGTDGTLWGGEFLVADLLRVRARRPPRARADARRRRRPSGSPGGWPRRISPRPSYGDDLPSGLAVVERNDGDWGRCCADGALAASSRRAPRAPAGCSTRSRRSSACATRSATKDRRPSSSSSAPTRRSAARIASAWCGDEPYPGAGQRPRPRRRRRPARGRSGRRRRGALPQRAGARRRGGRAGDRVEPAPVDGGAQRRRVPEHAAPASGHGRARGARLSRPHARARAVQRRRHQLRASRRRRGARPPARARGARSTREET